MYTQECVAMLLAGGQGTRLQMLTKNVAKPAVPFGGKYRIVDFTLSNCVNSGMDAIGVLTQYKPLLLNAYIGKGTAWDFDPKKGGVVILPPYTSEKGGQWYQGTADAVYQNINFVEQYKPPYVLVVSGDHIYKMDYSKMLEYHKQKNADVTISVIEVPFSEARRFGIMSTDAADRIESFEEKPAEPKGNLASMGVYIFNWDYLRDNLREDAKDSDSDHDFGKNIIPAMLRKGASLYAYRFRDYWKDVGTVESYWSASMDILKDDPPLDLFDADWKIRSINPMKPPHHVAAGGSVRQVMISEGCNIYGHVSNSILFPGVQVGEGSVIENSVIMMDVVVEENCVVQRAIIGEKTVVGRDSVIGSKTSGGVTAIGDQLTIADGSRIGVESRKN
ncbi:MAG: glucose-1-phosphate adenylyltransferase [Peptococcaceae bacterium]|jgi:glucose-1-phosphate adenylyltransferase|nr:glucose-1-phosphate adenylyltransferase [Peptococcaceae bacterium]